MNIVDWIVMLGTIGGIVMYGIYRGKQSKHSLQGFLLADRELPWYHVLLSVMATQASAITFYQLQAKPTRMACALCNSIWDYPSQ